MSEKNLSGNSEIITKKYTIIGLVQGVGFRPYVKRIADKFKINGTVKNIGGIVEIYATGSKNELDEFIQFLTFHLPEGSSILKIDICEIQKILYKSFDIISSKNSLETAIIPPDIATCDKCLAELHDHENRRYKHPFISCTICGPRYSIINSLPYDRCNTVMNVFPMCKKCDTEYNSVADKRCYAQTIACNDCGPKLFYTKGDNPIDEVIMDLKSEKVIAVKDIGGFHFVCLANSFNAVSRLRLLKNRKSKAFAVMFPSIDSVSDYAHISEDEKKILTSSARPIVLLDKLVKNVLPVNVCSDSYAIGAMLPCNPIQTMLADACGPLIMTSGNVSGEPIITNNSDIFKIFKDINYLDGVLFHNRDILTPLDDSIVRIVAGKTQIVRRGRGYVPFPIFLGFETTKTILALGGDLKSSFCLLRGNRAYMSQYFGDLENPDSFNLYKNNISHMEKLLAISPEKLAHDLHPGYYSSQYGKSAFNDSFSVQHHYAHIASVIAEHNLTDKVLGFAFDGTGYGNDKNIWGGEIILYDNGKFNRIGGLNPIKMLAGDEISKNADTVSMCYCYGINDDAENSTKNLILSALNSNINTCYSSSMGRLFDAVAALLGICHYNDYEGKCAILLEKEAINAKKTYPLILPFKNGIFNSIELIKQIIDAKNIPVAEIALGFHEAIADAIMTAAKYYKIKQIALSGGTFMNKLITELSIKKLTKENFCVYINEQVPCNDGGIALGQTYILCREQSLCV